MVFDYSFMYEVRLLLINLKTTNVCLVINLLCAAILHACHTTVTKSLVVASSATNNGSIHSVVWQPFKLIDLIIVTRNILR